MLLLVNGVGEIWRVAWIRIDAGVDEPKGHGVCPLPSFSTPCLLYSLKDPASAQSSRDHGYLASGASSSPRPFALIGMHFRHVQSRSFAMGTLATAPTLICRGSVP